jgi:hypothetical protein
MRKTNNNLINFLISILSLFFIFSCSSNDPKGILDEEKMTEMLQEVMLLENYYQSKYGSPSVYKAALDSSVEVIYKRFNTNKKQFSKSFDYYAQDPELFKKIQAKIIENLNSKHL